MSTSSGLEAREADFTDRKVDQFFHDYLQKVQWLENYPDGSAEMKASCEETARQALLEDCMRLPDQNRAALRISGLLDGSIRLELPSPASGVDTVADGFREVRIGDGGASDVRTGSPMAPDSDEAANEPPLSSYAPPVVQPPSQYGGSASRTQAFVDSIPAPIYDLPPVTTGPGGSSSDYNPDTPEAGEVDLQQLFNITEEGETQFNQQLLENLCRQIGNRKVAVISTAGKFRQGKTFWNNVLLRALQRGRARFEDLEYIGGRDGIRFRSGYVRHTQGIMVWPEIFIRKQADGTELAVMLLDTQGTFDNCSDIGDSTVIFAISLLMSSLNVFNTKNQIDAQDLDALNCFISFSQKSDEQIGQHFLIMMRDSNEAGLSPDYLELLKQQTRRAPQLHQLLNGVLSAFEKVDCYKIPTPSEHVRQASGEIRAGDCGENFLDSLCACADYILDNLQPKTVLGTALTGGTLKEHVENLVTHIKDGHHRAIGSAFTATSSLYFERARSAGNETFSDAYDTYARQNGHRALSPKEYDAKLEELIEEAIQAYRNCPLFGSQADKVREFDQFKRSLQERCKEKSISNKDRYRDMLIAEAVNGGMGIYETEMKPSIEEILASGKKGQDAERKHEAAFSKALDHFDKTVVEFADEVELLGYKRQLLHDMITARFDDIQNENAIMKAQDAGHQFFEELLQDYETRLKEKLTEVQTSVQVENILEATRSYCSNAYNVKKSQFVTEVRASLKNIKVELLEQMLDNYRESINYRFKKCEDDFAHHASTNLKLQGIHQKLSESKKKQQQWKKEFGQQMFQQKQANKELEKKLEQQKQASGVDPMMMMIQQMNEAARRQDERAKQDREAREALEARREEDRAQQRRMEMEMMRMEREDRARQEQIRDEQRREDERQRREDERVRQEAAERVRQAELQRLAQGQQKKTGSSCSIM